MHLSIRHATTYRYEAPPALALQRLRLGPPPGPGVRVLDWRVELDGAREEAAFTDGYANPVRLVSMEPGAREMGVTVTGEVEVARDDGVVGDGVVGDAGEGDGGEMPSRAPAWLYRRATALTEPGERARALAAAHDSADPLGSLHALTRAVRAAIDYRTGETDATTTAEDALARGVGVCQDHAHAFCAAARLVGVPARYVSGYLRMDDRDDQEAMHAWAEAWVDGLGWVGFDPANGHSPDGRYVAVARGLDYRDSAPVAGLVRHAPGAERVEALRVSISVVRHQSQRQGQQQSGRQQSGRQQSGRQQSSRQQSGQQQSGQQQSSQQ